jgi:hypothetical protein
MWMARTLDVPVDVHGSYFWRESGLDPNTPAKTSLDFPALQAEAMKAATVQ